MLTLRLTQTKEETGRYRVALRLEAPNDAPFEADSTFDFEFTPQQREDLRWYFEDYLQYPQDPAPKIAARVEEDMRDTGGRLFSAVFLANNGTHRIWSAILDHLPSTRFEIAVRVEEAGELPWELLFDPDTGEYLALQTHSFVHTLTTAARKPEIPKPSDKLRILLIICRPAKDPLPFRSDAMCILKALGSETPEAFRLDVLRPPTFEHLSRVLRDAKKKAEPYHIVHFDGHGNYLDVIEEKVEELHLLSPPRPGKHGYLLFENPKVADDVQLVDGPAFGRLLKDADVPVLLLNACRSAQADLSTRPMPAGASPHQIVRAFGSLAQEAMDAGVSGVVAMRYSVYVVTGAQFLVDLYAELARGGDLGEAVSTGRKQLKAQPNREVAYGSRRLEDWSVPIVYEAAPFALFPEPPKEAKKLDIKIPGAGADRRAGEEEKLDPNLPRPPDVGFFGRDETLLALDRAFDSQRIVLLHAFAGSGKTATSAEFARWYAETGGLDGGAVLFTKFEHYTPLRTVLGHFGEVFGPILDQLGLNWSAITETEEMRDVALQVLKQISVLWIWDNVEPITGFPKGTESAWSEDEQKELVDFLRDAKETKAKFLLTSRRDETGWLHDLPRRITIPPMPMMERVQLARALAERAGSKLTDVEDWRPLLEFTQGNPLTITVLVGQALRDGLKTKNQIDDFVSALRAGETAFRDEASEGRSKSLGASLSYGFEHAFSEEERKQLALLHLFQGVVNVATFRMMGGPEFDWCLAEMRGLSEEDGIKLLDKSAEIGLLTRVGEGYYTIHPALPWFFKTLFDKYYPSCHGHPAREKEHPGRKRPEDMGETPMPPRLGALRAYVEAMAELGSFYLRQYNEGNRDVIVPLTFEEANLLHARRLARRNVWRAPIAGTMQGLYQLYGHTGRRAEWKRLLEEIVPDFVDPKTEGPLPGRDEDWSLVTDYRVRLATEARQWDEAERLQAKQVKRCRQDAAPALAKKREDIHHGDRGAIRSLSASLSTLGYILREKGVAGCVPAYEEEYGLSLRIGDHNGAAVTAFNMGCAYLRIAEIRDLDQAQKWARESLGLRDQRDRLGHSKCFSLLGAIALERFTNAREAKKPDKQLLKLINQAASRYHEALNLLPSDAVDDLAVAHNQLGNIYCRAGDLDRALHHYRQSIRYEEAQGDLYNAARTRLNVAVTLFQAGRFADAVEYAKAGLRNYEAFGDRAKDMIEETQRLIANIEQALKSQDSQP